MSGGKMSPTASIYWLSTAKGLKEKVGQMVEVTGTFSPSRDEGKTGKITTTSDPATGRERIEVENGAKKAEATTSTGVAGTTGVSGATDVSGTTGVRMEIRKPYRRLEVKDLRMIGERCDAP